MALLARLFDRFVAQHWRAIDEERQDGDRGDLRAVLTVVTSAVVLTCMQYIILRGALQEAVASQLPELVTRLGAPRFGALLGEYRSLLRNITWSLGCAFFYLVVPGALVKLVFRERLRDWGLSTAGYFKHLWVYAVLFLPVGAAVCAVSFSEAFQQSYPFYKSAKGVADLVVWEMFYALQFFTLEFFFRGFMLHGLRRRLGVGAIFVMVVPYCMIHFQKPILETLAAILAGLVLGVLSLRTRSVLGGATIHVAVAVSMDIAALAQTGGLRPPG